MVMKRKRGRRGREGRGRVVAEDIGRGGMREGKAQEAYAIGGACYPCCTATIQFLTILPRALPPQKVRKFLKASNEGVRHEELQGEERRGPICPCETCAT